MGDPPEQRVEFEKHDESDHIPAPKEPRDPQFFRADDVIFTPLADLCDAGTTIGRAPPGRPPASTGLLDVLRDELGALWKSEKRPLLKHGDRLVRDMLKAKKQKLGWKTIRYDIVQPVHAKLWPKA